MHIFKSKSKSPHEVVKALKEYMGRVDVAISTGDKKSTEKAQEEVSRQLSAMKSILYGDKENDPIPELVSQLAQEMYTNNLLQELVGNISKFEFEAKKDVAQIFNNLLHRQLAERFPTVEYICTKEMILSLLVRGFQNPDIALHCGMMLRECLRHEALCKLLLSQCHEAFYLFFQYVECSNFDVASDAFATFKEALMKHKHVVAEFLEEEYTPFFQQYNRLLQSENYVTRRQSVKLLGELLLDRTHFNIMTRYIRDAENLKIIMNLLKDKSKNIQFEAFHVFKVFVANPHKTKGVIDILLRNREKLIAYLQQFNPNLMYVGPTASFPANGARNGGEGGPSSAYVASSYAVSSMHPHGGVTTTCTTTAEDIQLLDEKLYLLKQLQELIPIKDPPLHSNSAFNESGVSNVAHSMTSGSLPSAPSSTTPSSTTVLSTIRSTSLNGE